MLLQPLKLCVPPPQLVLPLGVSLLKLAALPAELLSLTGPTVGLLTIPSIQLTQLQ
jgi:hypothetical protein